ncbi:hypothetical protein C922_04043 [Plasmodium inui San Antonio 1]|uniref:CCZ1/INTU/HSP4 first Longin domain-containing protein n=1 Tax=Plasmodium inui San Antonio 1 TaxID=1237626 RepID=W6ZXN3_9APIC|nr:hypothetical protein C922_04043 [Plasmodium inui San Antonio 1]EUD65537.1 hypothetical protein C922_04043 [Plasmodium inui San Antonio 1]
MEKTKIEALFIYDEDVKKADKSVTDEELQAEKVIYYYPNETDEQVKVTHTSTMEGVSAFLSQFSKSHMDHIITKENLIVIHKWYKHIFVTVFVKNVYKNDKMELLMCKLLHSVLDNFISTFTLLHGHIRTFLKYKKSKTTGNMNRKTSLQTLLDDYVFTYVNTINNQCVSIHDGLQSFHFFPVEKHTYVTVQNLISSLILGHKQIKHGCLLYEGHLIYSSLEMSDTKMIYNYLVSYGGTVNNLKLNQHPFRKIASSAAINANGGLSSFARCNTLDEKNAFLLGIKKSSIFMPVVTLGAEKKYKLMALVYKGILLVLLIKGSTIRDEDFDILIDVQNKCTNENSSSIYSLSKLNEILSLQFKKYLNQDDPVRYLYYNNFSNSIKYSINNKKINHEDLFLVADFHFLLLDSEIKKNKIKLNKRGSAMAKEKEHLSKELFNFENQCIYKDASKDGLPLEGGSNKLTGKASFAKETLRGENQTESSPSHCGHHAQDGKGGNINDVDNQQVTASLLMENPQVSGDHALNSGPLTIEQKGERNDHPVEKDSLKKCQPITSETERAHPAAGGNPPEGEKKKKLKLVYNEELQRKLFEDTSDDVIIEKIFYKDASGPWIFAKKTLQRELFIFPDDSKISLSKAQHDVSHLMELNFANIYV